MKRTIDAESLAEAERILNSPLPLPAELPSSIELTASLSMLEKDTAYSIQNRPVPPLWTKVGNDAVQAYYRANADHPMADDDRARARRRAAFQILVLARQSPTTFTVPNMTSLHACLFDCDASVRHDLLRAIAFVGSRTSAPAVKELIEHEPESETVLAMATVVHKRLKS